MHRHDSLFTLIKGLNKTEKGYFRRQALTHGKSDSNYLRLFDAMDAQETYDEPEVKSRFKGMTFLKQFSVTKNYLYHLVLKSMEIYRQANSIDTQVRSLLNRADFLYEKAMYLECDSMLHKADGLSKKYELFHFELEILIQKRRLVVKDMNFDKLNLLRTENELLLKRINEIKKSEDTHDEIAFQYYKQSRKTKSDHSKKPNSWPVLNKAEANAKTFVAKKRFIDALIYQHAMHDNSVGVYESANKKALLYSSNPQMMRYDTYAYLISLNAVIYSCSLLRKTEEHKYWIGQLPGAEKFIHAKPEALYHFYLCFHILHFNNSIGNFEDSVTFYKSSMEEKLKTRHKDLNDRELFVLYINIAISLFGAGNYKESLSWLNKVKNDLHIESDPNAQCFYRLFYLIVHFELGHYDLIPYAIKSTYRFMVKMESLSPFQREWMSFLRTVLEKGVSRTELRKHFIQFRERLERAHSRELKSQTAEYFDYVGWLDSKIVDRPFAEVVREKANGKQ